MPRDALVVVPPLLKVVSGPLLGPAMLVGAGRAAGHRVRVLDLNARWLREQLGDPGSPPTSPFIGDHDRPAALLRSVQRDFARSAGAVLPPASDPGVGEDPGLTLTFDHGDVLVAARRFAESEFGRWLDPQLEAVPRPDVLGVSVMYSGQVLAALAVSIAARRMWPGILIVWGGAHVTALRSAISNDAAYGACVDRFVFGYAERTWVELLEALAGRRSLPSAAVAAGSGRDESADDDPRVVPAFDHLDDYGWGRLTLPAQTSRGCAYGRCTFCTYPAVEGRYRPLELDPALAIVAAAERVGAVVSFKDSLVVPQRLEAIAAAVGGRVSWSACTKLHGAFDARFLQRLAVGGCATLEFGLETLTPSGQLLIEKNQSLPLFLRALDAADAARIAVVINYITGFPDGDADEETRWLDRVRDALSDRPALVAKIEHNTFQLERMSPMGRRPAAFGLRVTRTWPWASVMAWEATAACRAVAARFETTERARRSRTSASLTR